MYDTYIGVDMFAIRDVQAVYEMFKISYGKLALCWNSNRWLNYSFSNNWYHCCVFGDGTSNGNWVEDMCYSLHSWDEAE